MGCCSSCLKPSEGDSNPQYQTIPNGGPQIEQLPPSQIDITKQTANALLEPTSASYQNPRNSHTTAPIEITPGYGNSGGGIGMTGIAGNRKSGSKAGFFVEYELKEEIGVGSTAKCFRCVRKSDFKEFACKVLDKRAAGDGNSSGSVILEQFITEIKVLRMLDHPNIIKLVDTFETVERIYVVMELMKGGELFDYVVEKGTLSEAEASVIIRKITSAVAHMHSMNIIHRDLKPENLVC
jgi:hypothetical protein